MNYSKLGLFVYTQTMAEERIDLLQRAVSSVLAALQMPDVNDDELH